MNKPTIRTLSFSIDELKQLLSIENAADRHAVIQALTENVEEPDKVDPDRYDRAHPMARCMAHKIKRRVELRRRRQQARERRKSEAIAAAETTVNPQAEDSSIASALSDGHETSLQLNQTIIARLLWLRRNHAQWIRCFFSVFNALTGSPVPAEIAAKVKDAIAKLYRYIEPLISYGSRYYHLPARSRNPYVSLC